MAFISATPEIKDVGHPLVGLIGLVPAANHSAQAPQGQLAKADFSTTLPVPFTTAISPTRSWFSKMRKKPADQIAHQVCRLRQRFSWH